MESKMPKITIVTVTFNAIGCLEKTINSIIEQNYSNLEYIIIDGGSIDGTIDIIHKYETKISCWISEPDHGIYDAMNKGIHLASGEWINFMNAGDQFASSDILYKIFNNKKISNVDFIYGDSIREDNLGAYYYQAKPFWESTKYCPIGGICHQSSFVRLDWAKKNNFDLHYRYSADYAFMWNLYNAGKKFYYIPMAIALYDLTNSFSTREVKGVINDAAEITRTEKKLYFYCWREYKYWKNKMGCFCKKKLHIRMKKYI